MAIEPVCTRPQIADLAAAVISRQLPYRDFEAAISNELKADPLVDELLDLILHEPGPIGWPTDASDSQHAEHMERVDEIIGLLRNWRD